VQRRVWKARTSRNTVATAIHQLGHSGIKRGWLTRSNAVGLPRRLYFKVARRKRSAGDELMWHCEAAAIETSLTGGGADSFEARKTEPHMLKPGTPMVPHVATNYTGFVADYGRMLRDDLGCLTYRQSS